MRNKYKILICALVLLGIDILLTCISYNMMGNWEFEGNEYIKKYGYAGILLMLLFNIPFLCLLLCSRERLIPNVGFMIGALVEFGCRGVGIASHPLLWAFGENGRITSSIILLLVYCIGLGLIIGLSAARWASWCRHHN